MERAPSPAVDVGVVNVGDVDHIHAATTMAPPRVVPIAWTDGQPADAAESAAKTKTDTEAPAASAPTEEGDVGRSPDGIVSGVHGHGARPPNPVTAVNEPA